MGIIINLLDFMVERPLIFVSIIIGGIGLLVLTAGALLPSWRWRKAVRVGIVALSWIGLVLFLAGTYPSFLQSFRDMDMALEGKLGGWEGFVPGYVFALIFSSPGAIVALIGGFVTRPRYLAAGLITAGAIYIVSFAGAFLVTTQLENMHTVYLIKPRFYIEEMIFLLPGLLVIAGGIIVSLLRKRGFREGFWLKLRRWWAVTDLNR